MIGTYCPSAEYLEKRQGGNFSGTDILYRNFSPTNFISNSWNGRLLGKKMFASQAQDQAMMFRLMNDDYSRLTLAIASSGKIDLRIRNANGTVARQCVSTIIPTVGQIVSLCYSWDAPNTKLTLAISTSSAYEVITSITQVSLPAFTEVAGVYVGNRADGTLGYKGRILGGSFNIGQCLQPTEVLSEARLNRITNSKLWCVIPAMFSDVGSSTIKEINGLNLTLTGNATTWWG